MIIISPVTSLNIKKLQVTFSRVTLHYPELSTQKRGGSKCNVSTRALKQALKAEVSNRGLRSGVATFEQRRRPQRLPHNPKQKAMKFGTEYTEGYKASCKLQHYQNIAGLRCIAHEREQTDTRISEEVTIFTMSTHIEHHNHHEQRRSKLRTWPRVPIEGYFATFITSQK